MLYRDILRKTEDVRAAQARIDAVDPDVLVLQGFDWDHDAAVLSAFNAGLTKPYAHLFSERPNTGLQTDRDLDGDGWRNGPGDGHGYGAYLGWSGMALLSRYPIRREEVLDLSDMLWQDHAPNMPKAIDIHDLRLASVGIWQVPLAIEGSRVDLVTLHAMPPGFDGPEDRNGWRNAHELELVARRVDISHNLIVVAGVFNVDPLRGEGRKSGLQSLLKHPKLKDPRPRHDGRDETVTFSGLGSLRVDYVLPDQRLGVLGSGIAFGSSDFSADARSRHGLVWVDLLFEDVGQSLPQRRVSEAR